MTKLRTIVCACATVAIGASQSPAPTAFEGAWTGTYIRHDRPYQSPKTWTYVFENIHDNSCTGFLWSGTRQTWAKCEIKDGEIAVYSSPRSKEPVVTGAVVSPTQLKMVWHYNAQVHYDFVATKQPPEFANSLVDPEQIAGVDREKRLSVYRALAEVVEDNVKKNDLATAAKLSRVLEVVFDRDRPAVEAELKDKPRKIWADLDHAMDDFIEPIMDYKVHPIDPAKVDAAYHVYLDRVKVGDAIAK